MSQKNARTAMPLVTAWVNDLREAFGRDLIDDLIAKATTEGLPTFYASENGYTVGVPLPALRGVEISAADMVINPPEKEPDADRNRRR
jgi:hypothetical protein